MVNIRVKGASAEREVAWAMNEIVCEELVKAGYEKPDKPVVQRNQNQSAVGGCDLVGTFGLAIEIKRQEKLAINAWWTQCVLSANARGEIPVLMYKQNNKHWKVLLNMGLGVDGSQFMRTVRAEIHIDDFYNWFRDIVHHEISKY